MRHFTIWQWTDYVLGLTEALDRSAMETHLSSRCPRCQRTVDLLRGVAVTARDEAKYEPPEGAIRYAQAIYSLHQPEPAGFPRLLARLVRDSAREPLPAGMRGRERLSRHALYEAGGYYLDLQMDHQPASGLVTLIGQLADRSRPATSAAEVPVWLMARKRVVASTRCNPFGEFQLDYAPARHLRLSFPLVGERKRLEVSLDGLSHERPSRPRSAKGRRQPSAR